jgi:hypothetical protein
MSIFCIISQDLSKSLIPPARTLQNFAKTRDQARSPRPQYGGLSSRKTSTTSSSKTCNGGTRIKGLRVNLISKLASPFFWGACKTLHENIVQVAFFAKRHGCQTENRAAGGTWAPKMGRNGGSEGGQKVKNELEQP